MRKSAGHYQAYMYINQIKGVKAQLLLSKKLHSNNPQARTRLLWLWLTANMIHACTCSYIIYFITIETIHILKLASLTLKIYQWSTLFAYLLTYATNQWILKFFYYYFIYYCIYFYYFFFIFLFIFYFIFFFLGGGGQNTEPWFFFPPPRFFTFFFFLGGGGIKSLCAPMHFSWWHRIFNDILKLSVLCFKVTFNESTLFCSTHSIQCHLHRGTCLHCYIKANSIFLMKCRANSSCYSNMGQWLIVMFCCKQTIDSTCTVECRNI